PTTNRLQATVQNIHTQIRETASDEASAISGNTLAEREITHMHRCLGDAVHVDDRGSIFRMSLVPTLQFSKLKCLATENHISQFRGKTVWIKLHQLKKSRRRLVQNRYAFSRDVSQKFRG